MRKYIIRLNDLINVKKTVESYPTTSSHDTSFVDGDIQNIILRIEYIKNGKIKILQIIYRKEIAKTYITGYQKQKVKQYYKKENIDKIVTYFITKRQVQNNSELQFNEEYIDLRSSEENSYIEKIIDGETTKTKKELRVSLISFIVIFVFIVVIAPMIMYVYYYFK